MNQWRAYFCRNERKEMNNKQTNGMTFLLGEEINKGMEIPANQMELVDFDGKGHNQREV